MASFSGSDGERGRRARPGTAIAWTANAKTGRFNHVSPEAEKVLGYPAAAWMEDSSFWQSHIHPEDRDWAMAYCTRRSKLLRPYEFEYRMLARTGKVVWLWDAVQVVARGGKPWMLFGVMVDITARKRKEEALRRQAATWAMIVAHLPDFLLTIARDGTILYANRVVQGLSQAEVVGSSLYSHVPITEASRLKSFIDRAVATGKTVHFETVGIGPRRTQALYSVRADPVKSDGRVEFLTLVSRDVAKIRKGNAASLTKDASPATPS